MKTIAIVIGCGNPEIPTIDSDADYIRELAKIVVDSRIGDAFRNGRGCSSVSCDNLTTPDVYAHCLEFNENGTTACQYYSVTENRCLINKFYEMAELLADIGKQPKEKKKKKTSAKKSRK